MRGIRGASEAGRVTRGKDRSPRGDPAYVSASKNSSVHFIDMWGARADIDTERVIIEVHLRPLLWDKSHELYKNRDARDAAWTDILKELAPHFESLSEADQKHENKKIQQRWRTARDTYSKEKAYEKKRPTGSGGKKRKKYGYYDMLTFLDKTTDIDDETLFEEQTQDSSLQLGNADPQPSSTNQKPSLTISRVPEYYCAGTQPSTSGSQIINEQPTHSTNEEITTKQKKRTTNSEFKTELLQYLKSSQLEIARDDLDFYKSIQPVLNGFNLYQKLMFRTKVLNLLMEMTQQFQSHNNLNQQQSISTSNTNYDSMSPFGSELSDQTNQIDQKILVDINEIDRDGAPVTESGTLPRPPEDTSQFYLEGLLNQTLQNTLKGDDKCTFSAVVNEDTKDTITVIDNQ